MPQFSNRINLSDEIKQVPITVLISRAKLLVKAKGYSQSTARHHAAKFNDLQQISELFNTDKLTEGFITRYIEDGMQKSYGRACSSNQRKTLLNLLAAAANSPPVFTYGSKVDEIQAQSLRDNLTVYRLHLKGRGIRQATIKSYLQTATIFLLYLDKIEKSAAEVSAVDIRDFVAELSARWSARSMQIVPVQLKTYLKFAGADVDAVLFSSFRVPRKSKPVRAMSNENVEMLWEYVGGGDDDLRSKAIVALLLATGIRPVDITSLKLNDISWGNDTVGFVQSKTDEYISFKLFPVVGSAIVRYITEQRPKGTGAEFVFLSQRAPYRRLTASVCNRILRNALGKAGVTFAADGLHCPRAVRRSLVSRMITKDIPVQTAAAAIGHVDEKSIDLYTELDVAKMKSICLPVPPSMKGWWRHNG